MVNEYEIACVRKGHIWQRRERTAASRACTARTDPSVSQTGANQKREYHKILNMSLKIRRMDVYLAIYLVPRPRYLCIYVNMHIVGRNVYLLSSHSEINFHEKLETMH